MGEPAGIGPDLTLSLWRDRVALGLPRFVCLGAPEVFRARAADLGISVPIAIVRDVTDATHLFDTALPVMRVGNFDARVAAGKPNPHAAETVLAAIRCAVDLTVQLNGSAIVTNPIAKSVLYEAGFAHPGHTEFLAALAARPGDQPPRPVMMIWSEALAVVPVTIHVPLADVPARISVSLIVETGEIVARDMRRRFGLERPRLALAGLNPHAGENGTIGLEDRNIIVPAVAALRERGIDARGPLPADTMFHARARSTYDVALCMYHDQALIPAKTLAFDEGVNVTLGLPFIRTSPDHGTAFDIAGQGLARPDSLLAAIRLARKLADTAS
jgi:4-hydroxythreonine-4-phosphate dehydrogenase